MKPSYVPGFCVLFLSVIAVTHGQVAVPTAQYSNARTGANLNEVSLNIGNINTASFGKLFSRPVDDSVYALPLYIPNVTIPGQGIHNVVYVVTVNNTVYAFDADDPAQSDPLWSRNIGPAPPVNGDLQTRWGTIGTPVIYNGTMYLVAYIGETTDAWSMYLCALDIATGADQYGPPSEILFPLAGVLTRATPYTIQRAGLLVSQNTLYIGFANYQINPPDRSSQEGFIFSYALNDISQPLNCFQVTNGQGGDIWQAGRGLAADDAGYIYANTGNGFYDGVTSFGDSVLKLDGNLNLTDWYTPKNWLTLYVNDLDISASGPILIPGTDYLIAGGKEGVLYLLRRSQLGQLQGSGTPGAVQHFRATNGCHLVNCSQSLSMAYWDRSKPNSVLYVWDRRDYLRAFLFHGNRFLKVPWQLGALASEMIGGITISANGSTPGTGILWALTAAENGNQAIVHGTLRAYDALNIQHELWNSDLLPDRDSMGNFTKFSSPVVANGKVYVITQSNQLQVYGLLNGAPINGN